jgi:hypothetical protein
MPSDLTLAHKAAQTDLAARTVLILRAIWGLLDPEDLDGTFETWLAAAQPVVTAHHAASARLAAQYLQTYRTQHVGGPGPVLPEPLDLDALATSLMVTGPVSVKSAVHRGDPLDTALDVAEAASAAAGARHGTNGGRGLIRRSLAADDDAIGYHRVASGAACNWCKSQTDIVFADDDVFHAHDGCSCTVEPVYR